MGAVRFSLWRVEENCKLHFWWCVSVNSTPRNRGQKMWANPWWKFGRATSTTAVKMWDGGGRGGVRRRGEPQIVTSVLPSKKKNGSENLFCLHPPCKVKMLEGLFLVDRKDVKSLWILDRQNVGLYSGRSTQNAS